MLTLQKVKERREFLRVARLAFSLEAANWDENYFINELGFTAEDYSEAVEKFDQIFSLPAPQLDALFDVVFPDAP